MPKPKEVLKTEIPAEALKVGPPRPGPEGKDVIIQVREVKQKQLFLI